MSVETSREAVERLAVAADEVWADLLQQMGRASLEGHAVGQMLAAHQREKIEAVGRTLRALLSERDAATARAEGAERERDEFQTRSIAMHRRVSQLESGATYRWLVELREQFRKERDAATAERDRLREALEIIAGYRQCMDNLMSNVDVARAALAGAAKEPSA